ncbi:MAG: bacteriohopanetetrol glucosamine biosynthesis glycosyltransferase HpnI [Alphaproteobacteria bacterium]|nr:bacteriohopanetetrol glucosamine biosynthesis glycosyltransferase HpnI [Alphaproteobacteria bacterium]MBV9420162.1 bacteriohopanetetrol glucosamine biosynthesis glycosyltransferase HpnI [Alphaproteobacteria bacterium]
MHLVVETIGWVFVALALAGAGYILLSAAIIGRFTNAKPSAMPVYPAVTLLKPLHFDSDGLAQDLDTFLNQDYPAPIQIVFGVQSESDPAIDIVRHLISRHPNIDIELVIDSRRYGSNAKICNLINMADRARHGVLVMSDSDIAVPRDYLRQVVSGLVQSGVGGVTVPYVGNGGRGWSRLAAMGTSYDFLPNMVFGTAFGVADACLGSTIALTRETLDRIGGFQAFANYLADDFEIGRAVRGLGLSVAVLPFAVGHRCTEETLGELFDHELRWSRTVRVLRPWSHVGTLITYPFPLALAGLALLGATPVALAALGTALLARAILKFRVDRAFLISAGPLWLLPVRDIISVAVFLASFFGQKVAWRGARFEVQPSGAMSAIEVR